MKYRKLIYFLQNLGKDPDTLTFEDKLTGFGNRRQLFHWFETRIDWANLRHQPLSLLMIGIDDLAQINNLYGKQAADEVILHIAGIMKASAASKKLSARYGVGEFIMLLPGKNKQEGLAFAESLVSMLEDNPFFSSETGLQIPVSMAIGVAVAPEDGDNGNLLVNRLDTALHLARKDGDGSIVDAANAGRLAIRYVHNAGIVGRKTQFDIISSAFKDLGKGKNQFFIIDGEPGMGKTCFIDTIQRNLEKTRLKPVRISGAVQESYRPYYLLSYVITALMNQREDKGVEIVETIEKRDLACLLHVIPQLADDKLNLAPGDFPVNATPVFDALNRFLVRLTQNRTLVLLIDDFHLADPASLHLIYKLMANKKPSLFICATAGIGEKEQSQAIPLQLFRTAYNEQLSIKSLFLNPLAKTDISKYISLIFPGLVLPETLDEELVRVTGGNPLFLVAIIIKMIEEQKIIQSDNRWTVAALDQGYFPESFEQIVNEKLDSLANRDKKFINRVSGFGEVTSLSMLEGFSRQESYQVYEIIKDAVKHGLMLSEFRENDESIRFSSKLVRQVIYERIGEEEKKKLHEEIGIYHEKLYFQNILPSPAFLVHHFKQSGNVEKANTYDQLMANYNKTVYDPDEEEFKEETASDEEPEDNGTDRAIAVKTLSDKGLEIMPEMLHALVLLIRNIRLYPEKSKSVINLIDQLMAFISEILETNERFSITAERNLLLVNSQPIETSSFTATATKILELWNRLELKSLTIKNGITEKELTTVIRQISNMKKKAVTPGFWKQFTEEHNLINIFPGQIWYTRVQSSRHSMETTPGDIFDDVVRLEPDIDHQFNDDEKKAIRLIIGFLMSAFNKIKLYPTQGQVATKAVSRVVIELHSLLKTWPVFTIAHVDNRLLVNGIKIDTSEFDNLAVNFLKFLSSAGLNSISFTTRVNSNEIIEFVKAACHVSSAGNIELGFWQKTAAQKQITSILFNQNTYDISSEEPYTGDKVGAEEDKKALSQTAESDLAEIPCQARELYLKGDIRGLEALSGKLTALYMDSKKNLKLKIIDTFHKVLFPKDWHPNAAYIKLIANHVITLLETEEEQGLLEMLFDLCHTCARTFILFGEYTFASWIYSRMRSRYAEAFPKKKEKACSYTNTGEVLMLGKPLGPTITDAITEDLKEGDRYRQQETSQLLSNMGPCMIPLLIDIIRETKDLRVRRLCAELIGKQGIQGVDMLKEALARTWRPEQKSRILEIIDMVTPDLSKELVSALADPDENVLRSTFKLIERLNTPETVAMIKTIALNGDSQSTLLAINTLVRLKPDFLAATLIKILNQSNDPELLTASCRAMGQTGDQSYIAPLSEILFPKRRFLRRKKYDSPVRIAAAFALAQIPGEKAGSVIQSLKKDPDARIREVASRYYPHGI